MRTLSFMCWSTGDLTFRLVPFIATKSPRSAGSPPAHSPSSKRVLLFPTLVCLHEDILAISTGCGAGRFLPNMLHFSYPHAIQGFPLWSYLLLLLYTDQGSSKEELCLSEVSD